MNNEITEELTKRLVEEYGKDEWYAVAQMSYPQLVEFCLSLRRQMRLASEGRLWETNEWKTIAYHLRDLLDDIDTATDTFKPDNDNKFTQYVYQKIDQANLILCSRDGENWEPGEKKSEQ